MKQAFNIAKLKNDGDGRWRFYCPGCQHDHVFYVGMDYQHRWFFNNDVSNPSFSPSLLNTWGKYVDSNWEEPNDIPPYKPDAWSGRCHLFVTNGKINYCDDCTHELNGQQNVEMKQY